MPTAPVFVKAYKIILGIDYTDVCLSISGPRAAPNGLVLTTRPDINTVETGSFYISYIDCFDILGLRIGLYLRVQMAILMAVMSKRKALV